MKEYGVLRTKEGRLMLHPIDPFMYQEMHLSIILPQRIYDPRDTAIAGVQTCIGEGGGGWEMESETERTVQLCGGEG